MTREKSKLYLQEINDFFITDPAWKEALNMAISALSQPERPKGRWEGRHGDKIAGENEVGETIYRHYHYYLCSECGTGTAVKQNYCGNCGADMRGEEE